MSAEMGVSIQPPLDNARAGGLLCGIASLEDRVVARLIDACFAVPIMSTVFAAFALWSGDVAVAGVYTFWVAIFLLPGLDGACICTYGGTPGKRRLGLMVTSIHGGKVPSLEQCCIRSLVFPLAFSLWPPLPLLVVLWAAINPHHRGLHDLAAGTWVVRRPTLPTRAGRCHVGCRRSGDVPSMFARPTG